MGTIGLFGGVEVDCRCFLGGGRLRPRSRLECGVGHDRWLELQADDAAFGWWRDWNVACASHRLSCFALRALRLWAERTGGDPAVWAILHPLGGRSCRAGALVCRGWGGRV